MQGSSGQVDFMLVQAFLSDHLPTTKASSHPFNEMKILNHSELLRLSKCRSSLNKELMKFTWLVGKLKFILFSSSGLVCKTRLSRSYCTCPPLLPLPNWRPSTKPASQSVRMIRSSNLVPLIYHIAFCASSREKYLQSKIRMTIFGSDNSQDQTKNLDQQSTLYHTRNISPTQW